MVFLSCILEFHLLRAMYDIPNNFLMIFALQTYYSLSYVTLTGLRTGADNTVYWVVGAVTQLDI